MGIVQIILGSAVLFLSVVTIVCICVQQGKSQGLGAMAGGSGADTFFGKNRSKDKNGMLSKITIIITILLAIVILVLDAIAILG